MSEKECNDQRIMIFRKRDVHVIGPTPASSRFLLQISKHQPFRTPSLPLPKPPHRLPLSPAIHVPLLLAYRLLRGQRRALAPAQPDEAAEPSPSILETRLLPPPSLLLGPGGGGGLQAHDGGADGEIG